MSLSPFGFYGPYNYSSTSTSSAESGGGTNQSTQEAVPHGIIHENVFFFKITSCTGTLNFPTVISEINKVKIRSLRYKIQSDNLDTMGIAFDTFTMIKDGSIDLTKIFYLGNQDALLIYENPHDLWDFESFSSRQNVATMSYSIYFNSVLGTTQIDASYPLYIEVSVS